MFGFHPNYLVNIINYLENTFYYKFIIIFIFKSKLNYIKPSSNKANSSNGQFFQRKIFHPEFQLRRNISKMSDNFYHEKISSRFDKLPFIIQQNLLILIAISTSIDECHIYEDVKKYKKNDSLTIIDCDSSFL